MNNRYEKIKDFLTRTDFNGFTKDDLFEAIVDFQSRERRFGEIKN